MRMTVSASTRCAPASAPAGQSAATPSSPGWKRDLAAPSPAAGPVANRAIAMSPGSRRYR